MVRALANFARKKRRCLCRLPMSGRRICSSLYMSFICLTTSSLEQLESFSHVSIRRRSGAQLAGSTFFLLSSVLFLVLSYLYNLLFLRVKCHAVGDEHQPCTARCRKPRGSVVAFMRTPNILIFFRFDFCAPRGTEPHVALPRIHAFHLYLHVT